MFGRGPNLSCSWTQNDLKDSVSYHPLYIDLPTMQHFCLFIFIYTTSPPQTCCTVGRSPPRTSILTHEKSHLADMIHHFLGIKRIIWPGISRASHSHTHMSKKNPFRVCRTGDASIPDGLMESLNIPWADLARASRTLLLKEGFDCDSIHSGGKPPNTLFLTRGPVKMCAPARLARLAQDRLKWKTWLNVKDQQPQGQHYAQGVGSLGKTVSNSPSKEVIYVYDHLSCAV